MAAAGAAAATTNARAMPCVLQHGDDATSDTPATPATSTSSNNPSAQAGMHGWLSAWCPGQQPHCSALPVAGQLNPWLVWLCLQALGRRELLQVAAFGGAGLLAGVVLGRTRAAGGVDGAIKAQIGALCKPAARALCRTSS